MKKFLLIAFLIPLISYGQFENRTHFIAGGNVKLGTNSYRLYKNYVVGAETILGFRIGKLFVGVGTGLEYTGDDYLSLRDSLNNEISKVKLYNLDVPIFADITYGKKFYVEAKLGYSVKVSNIKDYFDIQTHTLFNSVGFGYSIPISKKAYIDLALEGKFNYLFSNAVNIQTKSIYFMPLAKVGFRFTKKI